MHASGIGRCTSEIRSERFLLSAPPTRREQPLSSNSVRELFWGLVVFFSWFVRLDVLSHLFRAKMRPTSFRISSNLPYIIVSCNLDASFKEVQKGLWMRCEAPTGSSLNFTKIPWVQICICITVTIIYSYVICKVPACNSAWDKSQYISQKLPRMLAVLIASYSLCCLFFNLKISLPRESKFVFFLFFFLRCKYCDDWCCVLIPTDAVFWFLSVQNSITLSGVDEMHPFSVPFITNHLKRAKGWSV